MNIFGITSKDGIPVIEELRRDFKNNNHVNHLNIAHYEWQANRMKHDAIMLTYGDSCSIFTRDDWRHFRS